MYRVFAALALVFASWPAIAADVERRPLSTLTAPRAVASYNWSGAYAGINLGYLWGTVDNLRLTPHGAAGGAQAGYSWQTGQVVVGGEADIQASGAQDTFASYKFSNPWFGTVRGRGGYAFNNILVYGTVGLAFGELRANTFGLTESHTNIGWTAGIGAEVGLTRNWSAKVEYLYVDLANSNFAITGMSNGYSFGTLRAGVNYRF
ncbi:MAG: outer membrane protein [Xanthobacteraceae bacterium]